MVKGILLGMYLAKLDLHLVHSLHSPHNLHRLHKLFKSTLECRRDLKNNLNSNLPDHVMTIFSLREVILMEEFTGLDAINSKVICNLRPRIPDNGVLLIWQHQSLMLQLWLQLQHRLDCHCFCPIFIDLQQKMFTSHQALTNILRPEAQTTGKRITRLASNDLSSSQNNTHLMHHLRLNNGRRSSWQSPNARCSETSDVNQVESGEPKMSARRISGDVHDTRSYSQVWHTLGEHYGGPNSAKKISSDLT